LIFLRNGAFLFRIDENLEHPGTFRTEMQIGSWAEHLRQHTRMTKEETELAEQVWAMHAGDEEPVVRHYLKANRPGWAICNHDIKLREIILDI
jgi:hypothetical protein